MTKVKKYSKEWFHNFFKKIEDRGELGTVILEDKCALYHIGVRNDGVSYRFRNEESRKRFNALCQVLGEKTVVIDEYNEKERPNWKAVWHRNDNGRLLRELAGQSENPLTKCKRIRKM